ncbi:MAG: M48 family metallopeptidase [Pseudomonadota bacterium]
MIRPARLAPLVYGRYVIGLAILLTAFALSGLGVLARDDARGGGIDVGDPSLLRRLVSAEKVEQIGAKQYAQVLRQVSNRRQLLPPEHPQVRRVITIAERLLPHAIRFNPRAQQWRWEVNVVRANVINAFCMPGGKIALYTGLLERLKLTDAEVAMIMGHEIAHALREHARERMAKQMLTNAGAVALGWFTGSDVAGQLARMGGNLLSLKFNRDDETESDLIGMEIAARAGYDPRAGVTLWQKMSRAAGGQPMQFLSTHPSGENRIRIIQEHLPTVMPLYEAAG